ncbi:hypothetical protein FNV43_RR15247 [Rhamnella rubrinervis]|uniref:Disease resistance RPP13-like protein 1 n=1 Tax=Rhamnella rubrinervis TaxID=2594499 RepID=A0A8K0E7F0_9ROSA|nr:hypothetical protein FNV43_RR15247 [Rhamnella rubrinervis]
MALEVVGGAFLSASLHALFADIHVIVDFVRRNKVDEEQLRRLRTKLLLGNGVLDDAESQQITKPDVREWLEQLKDAILNAEDLVDDFKTEADRQMGSRVRNFFSSRFAVKDVERRIVNIIRQVDDIVDDMKRLGLREGIQTTIPFQIQRSSLNILAKESDVYGREHEKEAIIEFLLSDGGHRISVMPIVGMGGLGKTTLAQLVYRDVIDGKVVMEQPFVIKAWITVADESKSDVFTLTKAIYEAVNGPLDNTIKETFQVQLKLKDAMEGKKFLLVLDDVWNVDYQIWNDLQTPFESAGNGRKIIVTTRLPKIAEDLGTSGSEVLDLQLLSEADCWKLFSKFAFNNVEPVLYPHLEVIGRKIVEKCRGNPLAVKSLGCLLHSQLNPKGWENVFVNDIWELDQGEGGILPALWLSYYYLPRHLKRCFAYCSIFPKDYGIEKEVLILLWIAEGLLQAQNNMMLEEVGEKYFEDLTSRSFFHLEKGGSRFTMHDLVNDLAKFVSGESCLRLGDNCSGNLTRKTRHISRMDYETSDISKKLEDLLKNTVLRTLLVLSGSWHGGEKQYHVNPEELRSMQHLRVLSIPQTPSTFEGRTKLLKSIGRLKLLRYLDLSNNFEIHKIPDSICKLSNLQMLRLEGCENRHKLPESISNLKHLRYLNLSETPIEKIPDTICNLHELRTLSLSHCDKLTQLPTNFAMLTNLCNLDTIGTRFNEMPPKISNLKNLQTLSEYIVGKSNGIKELGKLPNLRGLVCITRLENVEEVEDASKANLKNKNNITTLILGWTGGIDVSHNEAREVLDRLQPHPNIEKLQVENYDGCKHCIRLPRLGELSSLKVLEIKGFDMVVRIDDGFYLNDSTSFSSRSCVTEPPFKSLKKLRFDNMREWEEWSLVDRAFPNLKKLELWYCPKLKGACLPDIYLPSLQYLGISTHQLMPSLSRCQFPSLLLLKVYDCPGMKSFPQGRLPSTIQGIEIRGCKDLVSLSEVGWPCSNLKSLYFFGCDKLFKHSSNKWNLGMLTSLTTLHINGADMEVVDSFPEEEGQLPTTLTSLSLGKLRRLKSLNGTALRHLTSLQILSISKCEELHYLPEEGLPASLSELSIYSRLPLLGESPSLKVLGIEGFDMVEKIDGEFYLNDSTSCSSSSSCVPEPPFKSLKKFRFENMGEWKEWSLVDGAFPNLKKLRLRGSPKLKGEGFPDYLPSLEELRITDNHHAVASLPRCQYPSLSLLEIFVCDGMESFPQGRLPSTIQTITIWGCNELVSLSEEGWPCSNLKSLEIHGCYKLFAHSSNKRNLGMLTSLTSLGIGGADMEGVDSFPEEEGQLPTTLTSLYLEELRNLKSLNGTALRHLTSLQTLSIHNCEELQYLPEERLPASVSELRIYWCPLLKPRCQRGIGQDWIKIQHITRIWIDREFI